MMPLSRLVLGFMLSLFVFAGSSAENRAAMSYEITGYVVDMLCGRLEIAPDDANMITSPEDHTVMCELLSPCLRSGYGVSQNIGTGDEKEYRVSASFDQAGNDYVVHMLRQMETSGAQLQPVCRYL
eukprot:3207185-Rhodomonas_salina.2